MIKRYVVIDNDTFALSYHPKTGMLYVVTPRRNERKLQVFLEYIKPEHFIAAEWSEGSGRNFSTRIGEHDGSPIIMRRAGQHSKLIYKSTMGALLSGFRQMDAQGISVVETETISSYRR